MTMSKKIYKYNGDIVDRDTFYKELEFDMSIDKDCMFETLKEAIEWFDTPDEQYIDTSNIFSNFEIINGESFECIIKIGDEL